MSRNRVLAALAAAGAAAIMLMAGSSAAMATGGTNWVSPNGHSGKANSGCGSAAYSSINAALADTPNGGVVRVCAGTYNEQVVVDHPVSITGSGSASTIIQGPSSPAVAGQCNSSGEDEDVVDVCTSGSVSLAKLTVKGGWPSNVCYDDMFGITVFGGANATLKGDVVTGVGGDALTDGCQGGVGIQVGRNLGSQAGTASMSSVTVTNYQKTGVVVDGPGNSAVIKSSTVTGAGASPAIAQNGIQISRGASGTIQNSTVTGNECDATSGGCGPDGFSDTQSCGVLLFDPSTTLATKVTGSNISDNDIGIYNLASGPGVTNVFQANTLANRYENVGLDQGSASVTKSTLSGGEVGIMVFEYDGQTTAAQGSASSDTISGASTAAVQLESDNAAGDVPAVFSVTTSDLSGSAAGVLNNSSSVVSAKKDWWGDVNGPSSWSFGAGVSVDPNVDFFPWYTSAGGPGLATCTSGSYAGAGTPYQVFCGNSHNNVIRVTSGAGPFLILGGGGNDQLTGSGDTGAVNYIIGSSGDDLLNGMDASGAIQGRGGNDICLNDSNYQTNGC